MRLTTFGGPTDEYDRAYHQAYLPEPDRSRETPADYFDRVKPWVQAQLNPAMATVDAWPVMEQYYYRAGDVKNKVKRLAKVGVSFYLQGMYAAWDIPNNDRESQRLARRGWLYVQFDYPGGTLRARVTDHGNSGAPRSPVMDVSPDVAEIIRPHWPHDVSFRLVVVPE